MVSESLSTLNHPCLHLSCKAVSFDVIGTKAQDNDKGVVRLPLNVFPDIKRGDIIRIRGPKGAIVRLVRRIPPAAAVCSHTIGLQYEDRKLLGANTPDTTSLTFSKPIPVLGITQFFFNHPDPLLRMTWLLEWKHLVLGFVLGVVATGFF